MPKVKNESNPVYIGKKLCKTGIVTEVSQKDLEYFLSTRFGSALFNDTLFVIDQLAEGKAIKKFDALKAKAMAECRQELGPVIEKEITEKLEKKYQGKIESLEKIITDMEATAAEFKKNSELKIVPDDTTKEDKSKDPSDFVFDPEKHHVEHRGAGRWFVMEKEEKVYGPLSEEEKKKFDEIMTGSI